MRSIHWQEQQALKINRELLEASIDAMVLWNRRGYEDTKMERGLARLRAAILDSARLWGMSGLRLAWTQIPLPPAVYLERTASYLKNFEGIALTVQGLREQLEADAGVEIALGEARALFRQYRNVIRSAIRSAQ